MKKSPVSTGTFCPLFSAHSFFFHRKNRRKFPVITENFCWLRKTSVVSEGPNSWTIYCSAIIFPSPDCLVRRHPVRGAELCVRSCNSVRNVRHSPNQTFLATRETREGWPLLTVETEVNGDSKSTNEMGSSFVGSFVPVQVIFFCLACSSRPSVKYYFSSPYTISVLLIPSPRKLGRQSCSSSAGKTSVRVSTLAINASVNTVGYAHSWFLKVMMKQLWWAGLAE